MAAGHRRRRAHVSSSGSDAAHVEFTRRVYENSKITIPKEIRELHDIAEGDFVVLKVVKVVRGGRTETAVTPENAGADPEGTDAASGPQPAHALPAQTAPAKLGAEPIGTLEAREGMKKGTEAVDK
ncbi:MAG: hypothetical protein HY556_10705 [Euryarchaeota archaeon]|nr:hypothetical protein [Euryarchaeota archaeon]